MIPWRQRAFLRPTLVHEVTGLSISEVRRKIKTKAFRAVRDGRMVLIPVEDVIRYIDDLKRGSPIQGSRPDPELDARVESALSDFGLDAPPGSRGRRPPRASGARKSRG